MTSPSRAGRWSGVCGICIAGLLATGCYSNSLQSSSSDTAGIGDPLALIGLRADPAQEEIEYGPRAPLVIPGQSHLPPPQSQMAAEDPAWPDDPDVRQRRQLAEARRAASEQTLEDVERASQPLTRAELDEWGRRFGRHDPTQPRSAQRDPSAAASPEELRARTASVDGSVEPPRRRLSDPPGGYRQPADTDEVIPPPRRQGFFSRLFGGGRGSSAPREHQGGETDPARDF
jgi:hypothetical protein